MVCHPCAPYRNVKVSHWLFLKRPPLGASLACNPPHIHPCTQPPTHPSMYTAVGATTHMRTHARACTHRHTQTCALVLGLSTPWCQAYRRLGIRPIGALVPGLSVPWCQAYGCLGARPISALVSGLWVRRGGSLVPIIIVYHCLLWSSLLSLRIIVYYGYHCSSLSIMIIIVIMFNILLLFNDSLLFISLGALGFQHEQL